MTRPSPVAPQARPAWATSAVDGSTCPAVEVHRQTREGAPTLVKLASGAITVPAARSLEKLLAQLMGSGSSRVLLDFSDVTFVDRAGLDVLLDVRSRIVQAGGELELITPSAMVVLLLHEAAQYCERANSTPTPTAGQKWTTQALS